MRKQNSELAVTFVALETLELQPAAQLHSYLPNLETNTPPPISP
jgi:hypothetical protein